jgi:Catalytic LigB subunit of aromatic ring-opening dioxygenase
VFVLGLAASFAPPMFREAAEWPTLHDWLVGDAPQPDEYAAQTPEMIDEEIGRINSGFARLREQLDAARPDVLLMLASDTGRVFTGVQVPQFCTYVGAELWGSTRYAELGEIAEDDIVRLTCAAELAGFVNRQLVERGFDMSYSEELRPLGQPEFGTSPAFVAPAPKLLPEPGMVPVVPIYVNTQTPPAPSGRRCYAFGRALAEILDQRTERVAIFASGGLSHDHHGSRAGWVDQPLDEWVLDQLARGQGSMLQRMFDLESDSLRGGAAQVRLWAIVAGASEGRESKAVVVDYVPSYAAATGVGFAFWPLDGQE